MTFDSYSQFAFSIENLRFISKWKKAISTFLSEERLRFLKLVKTRIHFALILCHAHQHFKFMNFPQDFFPMLLSKSIFH